MKVKVLSDVWPGWLAVYLKVDRSRDDAERWPSFAVRFLFSEKNVHHQTRLISFKQ